MHIVEVRRAGEGLVESMGRMRDWLDAQRITPRLFELNTSVFRVAFTTASEAAAFAGAFGGQMIGEPSARAA
jgi:hypothetical protein